MLFNSLVFFGFLSIVLAIYWIVLRRSWRVQNYWLLTASYVFYGAWDWRFLSLILASTIVDFYVGKSIFNTENKQKQKSYLWLSVGFNLGILALFKYFNFFTESLAEALQWLGFNVHYTTLQFILPVGISFYTFQTLSYTIDIYRQKMQPTQRFTDFALYVSFFPQLVAGPIERATSLLPQIQRPRQFNIAQIYVGVYLILWGLFKKVVIADNLAQIVNPIFNQHENYVGLDLGLAVVAFAFQIYCDFSGYTDIARGVAKLLGFDLMLNFKLPYFARQPSDFWRRWHISLSSWLRDYLYISLGGNRGSRWFAYRNLFLTMLLGGLWHGAAWNFIWWGAYHGLLLIGYKIWNNRYEITASTWWTIPLMFLFTLYGWLLFRAESVAQIIYFTTEFNFTPSKFSLQILNEIFFFISPLVLIQFWQLKSGDLLVILKQKTWIVTIWLTFLTIGLVIYGVREPSEFIYFQF